MLTTGLEKSLSARTTALLGERASLRFRSYSDLSFSILSAAWMASTLHLTTPFMKNSSHSVHLPYRRTSWRRPVLCLVLLYVRAQKKERPAERMLPDQYQRHQQPAYPAVSIPERADRLELVVGHGAQHQHGPGRPCVAYRRWVLRDRSFGSSPGPRGPATRFRVWGCSTMPSWRRRGAGAPCSGSPLRAST